MVLDKRQRYQCSNATFPPSLAMIFTLVIQNELACKEPQGRPQSVRGKGLEIM